MSMTVEAIGDQRGGFKYKIPGVQGFVTPARKTASIMSPTYKIAREVKELAFALKVKLPESWELVVRR